MKPMRTASWTLQVLVAVILLPMALGKFVGDTQTSGLFEQIDIPLVDVSEMTLRVSEGENSQEDVEAMAQARIADNRDAVDAWLEVAREHAEP